MILYIRNRCIEIIYISYSITTVQIVSDLKYFRNRQVINRLGDGIVPGMYLSIRQAGSSARQDI